MRYTTYLWQKALQDFAEGLHLGDGGLIHNLNKIAPAVLQADFHIALKKACQQWPVVCSLNPLDPGVYGLQREVYLR